MSKFIRNIRFLTTKKNLKMSHDKTFLDKEAYQAYLQSVCDPTGEYHQELTNQSITNNNLLSEVDDQLNDYLSELAIAHSKCENHS